MNPESHEHGQHHRHEPLDEHQRPLHIIGPNNKTLCGGSPKRLRELGPAETNEIVKFVRGLNPLP